jgi:hypothetical protein
MASLVQRLKNKLRLPPQIFRYLNRTKEQFQCPVCSYSGPFADVKSFAGVRTHAQCPQCGTLERHRVQYLVLESIFGQMNPSKMKMLHFAPEPFFKAIFLNRFGKYETADLFMKHVDHQVDIQNLPFDDGSYDFIFASHVLEHIQDDQKALKEIRRVLKPNGIAILPVPVVCDKTIEYPEANPNEAYHVRAPGLDYYQRYKKYFSDVEIRTSNSLPEKNQPFIYENRSVWPTKACPLRPPMSGEKHADFVPICHV